MMRESFPELQSLRVFHFFCLFFLEVDSRPYNTVYSLDYIAPQSDSVTYVYLARAMCLY